MSNLGAYQEFVTAAARMGGVENMIRTIESGAVAKAAPALLGKGAGIGALITGSSRKRVDEGSESACFEE